MLTGDSGHESPLQRPLLLETYTRRSMSLPAPRTAASPWRAAPTALLRPPSPSVGQPDPQFPGPPLPPWASVSCPTPLRRRPAAPGPSSPRALVADSLRVDAPLLHLRDELDVLLLGRLRPRDGNRDEPVGGGRSESPAPSPGDEEGRPSISPAGGPPCLLSPSLPIPARGNIVGRPSKRRSERIIVLLRSTTRSYGFAATQRACGRFHHRSLPGYDVIEAGTGGEATRFVSPELRATRRMTGTDMESHNRISTESFRAPSPVDPGSCARIAYRRKTSHRATHRRWASRDTGGDNRLDHHPTVVVLAPVDHPPRRRDRALSRRT